MLTFWIKNWAETLSPLDKPLVPQSGNFQIPVLNLIGAIHVTYKLVCIIEIANCPALVYSQYKTQQQQLRWSGGRQMLDRHKPWPSRLVLF